MGRSPGGGATRPWRPQPDPIRGTCGGRAHPQRIHVTTSSRVSILATGLALLALSGCGDDPTGPSLTCTGGSPLTVGGTVNGTLQQGDDLDIDGAFLDRYALTVTSSATIAITMRSNEVDAFLWLLDPEDETVIASNDDGGGGDTGLDARIQRSFDRGCYWVEATSALPGHSGAYTLTVQAS